jgi:hypothetical protein
MPPYRVTEAAVATFVVIPVVLAIALVWATIASARRAGGSPATARRAGVIVGAVTAAWMAVTWAAAATGIIQNWDRTPPPFVFVLAGTIALALWLSLGPIGGRMATDVPLWALVAIQAFRLPLELAMHALYERGIMPMQMSYSGRNFDILTGASAVVVAIAVRRGWGGRRLVGIWNVAGLALLVNVVTVAILSTPFFRVFGDDRLNTFVTYTPFVWLPAVMVLAALAGHLVIFRALGRL